MKLIGGSILLTSLEVCVRLQIEGIETQEPGSTSVALQINFHSSSIDYMELTPADGGNDGSVIQGYVQGGRARRVVPDPVAVLTAMMA